VIAVLDRHLDDDHYHRTLLDPADRAERGLEQRAAEKGRRERLAVINAVRLRQIADRMRHSSSFIPPL